MKKTIGISKTLGIALAAWLAAGWPLPAAETGQINYQARLLDSYGRRLNTTVNLSFEIYDAAANGNLLWSETHANVVVEDGVYSVVLGSQTPIPASVFSQNAVYLELGVNGEIMTPRPQILASAYALVARTVMGANIFENQANGYLGIGTTNPAAKLDVVGTLKATGFQMPSGAIANYVLASDAEGAGAWQPLSAVFSELDPIHTNWVRVVYTPATNSIWGAIGSEAATRAAADTALQGNINTSSNALQSQATALQGATNALNTRAGTAETDITALKGATNALDATRVRRTGDSMTGALTNTVLFAGNGLGLTNIQSSGVVLTGYVLKVGDTMTGPMIISNNLTITLTNQAGYFVATNSITLGELTISNWNSVAGNDRNLTNDLSSLRDATNTLSASVDTLNTSTNALNARVGTAETDILALEYSTNALNTRVGTAETDILALEESTNALNARVTSSETDITGLQGSTNSLNATRVLRTGDTMTGELVISNNLTVAGNVTVSGTNQVNVLYVTNAIIFAGGWTGVVTNMSTLITNVMYFSYGICTNVVVNP